MKAAIKFSEVLPGVFSWDAFSPDHGAPMTSHAVAIGGRFFLFDPIPLEEPALSDLADTASPAIIVLTSNYHVRDADRWRRRLRAPVWADGAAQFDLPGVLRLPEGDTYWEGWKLHRFPGAGRGETAFRRPEMSLVVVGDALVNLPGRGLEIYPTPDPASLAQLRQNARKLASVPFENLVFAHGSPIVGGASAKVLSMLDAPQARPASESKSSST